MGCTANVQSYNWLSGNYSQHEKPLFWDFQTGRPSFVVEKDISGPIQIALIKGADYATMRDRADTMRAFRPRIADTRALLSSLLY